MSDEKLIEQFNSARAAFLAQDFIVPQMVALESLCRKFPLLMENAEAEETKKSLASGCADLIETMGSLSHDGAHINAINATTKTVETLGVAFLNAVDPTYFPQKLASKLGELALGRFDLAEQQINIAPAQAIRNEADVLAEFAKKIKALQVAPAPRAVAVPT